MLIIVAKTLNVAIKNVVRTSLIKGDFLPRCNSQQIISQYDDNTSFTMRVENVSVNNIGIASGLEINWHNNVAYWCGWRICSS